MSSVSSERFRPLHFLPPTVKQFLLPSLAGCMAVVFSHPLELIKVRLQLDRNGATRSYRGWFHCFVHTWKTHGLRGLENGLQFGLLREFFFNAIRFGCYDQALHTYASLMSENTVTIAEKFAVGLGVGAFAGCVMNPIEVLKTRNQALGGLTGHQHVLKSYSIASAAVNLYKSEGISGYFRGVGVQTVRGILGPGTQLPAYNFLKEHVSSYGFDIHNPIVHMVCSAISGGVSIIFCNPADTIRTRIYNQPIDPVTGKGQLYSNAFDAAVKIVRTEGIQSLYKGGLAHYGRLGPHIVLVFMFLEQLKLLS